MYRSEEHTSELQSQSNLVCRLLLDTACTPLSTLSLHDALPISSSAANDSNDPPRGDKVRLNEVKARAARDFGVRYPQIGNERWYRYAEGFSAKFSQNQVLSNV